MQISRIVDSSIFYVRERWRKFLIKFILTDVAPHLFEAIYQVNSLFFFFFAKIKLIQLNCVEKLINEIIH